MFVIRNGPTRKRLPDGNVLVFDKKSIRPKLYRQEKPKVSGISAAHSGYLDEIDQP